MLLEISVMIQKSSFRPDHQNYTMAMFLRAILEIKDNSE